MAAILTMKNKFIAPLNVFSCAGTADLGLVNLASNPVGFPHQHKTVSPQSVRVVGGGQEALEVPWERKHYKILQRERGGRGMEKEKE